MRTVYLIVVFALVAVSPGLFSQQALSASGGDASGTTGSISYTVGQTFFNSYSSQTVAIHEGVQQPYEIFIISSVESTNSKTFQLKIYPNPVLETLIIESGEMVTQSLKYQLLSPDGKLHKSGQFSNNTNYLSMGELPSGLYFLTFYLDDSNTDQQTFQIIKIK